MSGVSVDLGCSPAHENGSLSPSLPLFVIKVPGPSLLHTSRHTAPKFLFKLRLSALLGVVARPVTHRECFIVPMLVRSWMTWLEMPKH